MAPLEQRPDEAAGRLVEERRPRLGRRLQPRRRIDRVAEGGVLDAPAAAEQADDDWPGGDADADRDSLDPPRPGDLVSVDRDLVDYPERRPGGALGVVLGGRRGAEEREHAVAGEVLDVAAEVLDDADDPGDRVADHEPDLFGLEPLPERRRSDEVGEQGGDHPPLLADMRAAELLRHRCCSVTLIGWAPSQSVRRPSSGKRSFPSTTLAKWLPASAPALLAKLVGP